MLGAMARVAPARPAKLTNGQRQQFSYLCRLGLGIYLFYNKFKSSQVNTLPKAKSQTRNKQNKDMHKCSSVYSERGVPLPVLTSGGE
jgi:hypothetical protein